MVHKWVEDYAKYDRHPKTLLYHHKDEKKTGVLLLGETGILAINIGGTTICSGLEFLELNLK